MIIEEKATHAGDLRRLVNSDPLMVMDRACLLRPGDEQRQHRSGSYQGCLGFLRASSGRFHLRWAIDGFPSWSPLSTPRQVGHAFFLKAIGRENFEAGTRIIEVPMFRFPSRSTSRRRDLQISREGKFSCVPASGKFLLALSASASANHIANYTTTSCVKEFHATLNVENT